MSNRGFYVMGIVSTLIMLLSATRFISMTDRGTPIDTTDKLTKIEEKPTKNETVEEKIKVSKVFEESSTNTTSLSIYILEVDECKYITTKQYRGGVHTVHASSCTNH